MGFWQLGAGLQGGLGQILLTLSYRHADARVLAPFTYVSMIWALIIRFLAFGEIPTLPILGGAALAIGSGDHSTGVTTRHAEHRRTEDGDE